VDGEIHVSVDAGTHKVCALVGEVTENKQLRVIGVGISPNHGMKRGMVSNVDEVGMCVANALERAERVSGCEIQSATVSINGNHISSVNSRGVVAVARPDHEITASDVDRVIEAARAIAIPENREILHVIPRHFIVDGQEGVPDPVGMFGFRLEVDAHIVTISKTARQNLERSLAKAGIEVRDFVAAPLASAEAVVTQDDKDMGLIVADIGAGTTGIAVFVEGAPWHTTVLQVGGAQVTNDVTVGLRLPFQIADDLKVRYAHALASTVDRAEVLDVPGAPHENRTVSRLRLCEITEDRIAELFALILNEVKRSGHDGLLPGGVVLTGGTAELPGIAELGREVLGLPVRVGIPQGFGGLTDSLAGPAYATSVGLLQWAARHEEEGPTSTTSGPIFEKLGQVPRKVIEWFKHVYGS